MYIIRLSLFILVIFFSISSKVIAQSDVSTEHYLEIYIRSNYSSEISHKIKITNNDKYNGVKSLDFSEIGETFNFTKNFNINSFDISTLSNKPIILLSQPLIGPKSVEIGYTYNTNKIFYKNGLNYVLKLIKLNDSYMDFYNLKIYLSDDIAKLTPISLRNNLKKDEKKGSYLEFNIEESKQLGNEIIFGEKAVYLLTSNHLISKEKPYIIIPANIEQRQYTKLLKISKKPIRVYKKYSNIFFEYEKVEKPEFVEASYYIEIYNSKILAREIEQIGLNLTSKQKNWNYLATNIQKDISEIKKTKLESNYPKLAYEKTLSKFTYSNSNENFSFISRIGAENVNEQNSINVYCLDYTDYLISLLRGLNVESAEADGYFFQTDIKEFNVPKLHSWVLFKDSQNSYKEVDPTFEDTSQNNYFNSFDLAHIILTIKLQNSETPYVFGTHTKGNMYESLKIESLNENQINSIKFESIKYANLYFAKIVINDSGFVFSNLLPFETKIINNFDFEKIKNSNKKLIFENKSLYYFLPKSGFVYISLLIPILIIASLKIFLGIKKKRNKGKKVRSVLG